MAKVLSEKTIYKRVGTSDFSSLSPDQLKSFVSILNRISPEMAKQLMNQFSDFRMSANRITGFLRMDVLDKTKSKSKTQSEVCSSCMGLLKELDYKLSQEKITEADKVFIENRIVMVASLLKADTKENRAKALKVISLVSMGVLALAGVALSIIFLALANSDDSTRKESSDSGEKDDDDYEDYEYDPMKDLEDYYDALDEVPDIEFKLLDPNYDPMADPDSPFYLGPFNEIDIDYDDEDDYDENDESYAAQDYIDSRPWGIDNDGY